MIVLITGASHTGKTLLAQKLMKKYKYPYLSIDHLKMGLIRSGYTNLSVLEDDKLTKFMWPILCEMIKTAIENNQNLIIEGSYIPFDWKKSFDKQYLENINCYCLVMSKNYIHKHFDDIKKYANVIEYRIDETWCTLDSVLRENKRFLYNAKKYDMDIIYIDENYQVDINLDI